MKKNGFVFIESIVVLVVVALSLAMMISSYSLVSRKTKEKEYYNKASDKYLLYSVSSVGTDDNCNYGIKCSGETKINFHATGGSCSSTKLGKIMYQCEKVFEDLNISDIYVVDNIIYELKNNYNVKELSGDLYYKNGVLEYMKTLRKCNDNYDTSYNNSGYASSVKYMIGVFKRGNNDYYYAAIEL